MPEQIRLTDRYSRQPTEAMNADARVWQIMDLVCAEWESDPTSVMCFDLRIVQEAIALVRRRKAMLDPFNPFNSGCAIDATQEKKDV